jgi:hypothetical protein
MLKPLFVLGLLVFSVVYWTGIDRPRSDQPAQGVQIAQATVLDQQLALAREQQAGLEVSENGAVGEIIELAV